MLVSRFDLFRGLEAEVLPMCYALAGGEVLFLTDPLYFFKFHDIFVLK